MPQETASSSTPEPEPTFFRADGDALIPTDLAQSMWRTDHVHGVAVAGVLARELENAVATVDRPELRPARYTVDLFRPALFAPARTRHTIVRESGRLVLVDAFLVQDHEVTARASGLFLKPTAETDGEVWSTQTRPEPPPIDLAPESNELQVPFLYSEDVGWSQSFTAHQNGSRKQYWQVVPGVVEGEATSGFQVAACVADSTNLVCNWGSRGVEYINTDITVSMTRLPISREVGLRATDRISADGIAVGTAEMYDRQGLFGTTLLTSLANSRRAVNFETDAVPGVDSASA